MMTNDYIYKARLLAQEVPTKVSESELIATREDFRDSLQDIQKLQETIAREKQQALDAIDSKYEDQLANLNSNYALLITLAK